METRDPKTGELLRVNADDDDITLGEMLRQEKFSAGIADQKDLDRALARAIATDGKFEVSCPVVCLYLLLMVIRTISNTLMITPRNLVARRCAQMP